MQFFPLCVVPPCQALEGLFSPHPHVRAACLEACKFIPPLAAGLAPSSPAVASALWMAQFDPTPENAEAAEFVWDMYGHQLGEQYGPSLMAALANGSPEVRQAAAEGLAAAMDEYKGTIPVSLAIVMVWLVLCDTLQ